MLWIVLLLSAFIPSSHASSSCDAGPISIPIQDTQVLDDVEGSYMIGLRTKLGTPAQDILMLPWAELNNTWVYDYQPYCDDTIIRNDLICRVRRGDYFFENASTTYARAVTMQAAGGATQETTYLGAETGIPNLITSSINGDDVIEIGSANLTSFPIGIPRLESGWDHGYTTLHALGLGKNSTFLNSLLRAGQIASLSWSLFWGRMWVDDWLDGSLVLGGYDSKVSVGDNYTQALDYSDNDGTGCFTGMKVTITGIELNFSNGSDVTIYEDALPVCIVPQRQLLIEGPRSIREAFENTTGMVYQNTSYGLHWSAVQYSADGAYDGDMTITLSSGLAVRIPNSQFLPPYVDIADDGSRVYDDSIKEFLYNSVGNQPASLGRYFFTAAYLTVNHDTNYFTLSKAEATTESNLVPIVSDSTAQSCSDGTTGSGSEQATGTADPASTAQGSSGHTSTGAIAGGVVGGVVAALAVAGVAAFMLVRRRRKRNKNSHELSADPGPQQDDPVQSTPFPYSDLNTSQEQEKLTETHEMGAWHKPPELAGREVPQGQDSVYEMSSDTHTVYEIGHGR